MGNLDFSFFDGLKEAAPDTRSHQEEAMQEAADKERQAAADEEEETTAARKRLSDPMKKAAIAARKGEDLYKIVEILAVAIRRCTRDQDNFDDLMGALEANYGVMQGEPGPLRYQLHALRASIGNLKARYAKKAAEGYNASYIGDMIRTKEKAAQLMEKLLQQQGEDRVEDKLRTIDYLRDQADQLAEELEADTGKTLATLQLESIRQPAARKKRATGTLDETPEPSAPPTEETNGYDMLASDEK